MADDNKDLVRFATEYAEQDIDLYELLGVDALTPKDDIHRAWRKRSLKYHPDKAGDGFDASKWELFERARDVLSDQAARAAYAHGAASGRSATRRRGASRPGPQGPANGAVDVPGNYVVSVGEVDKRYWELVCDKLRAVQTMRNLQKQAAAADELEKANDEVQEARRRIYDAEAKYRRETEAA
ncbi:hypothetical protein HIM_08415 [Hirsutella minnesotensis 3608]|uniref:J domain-containing protein n=1 Tax=Hirsutella minnesotensis 3608 TaxID=1043627 RepID=A0A0F7ZMK3_9HYPO|nr:hypothetical protein HIM_08415 [Hirsutella minnesotensis 3608]